jgi:hypothetical protein
MAATVLPQVTPFFTQAHLIFDSLLAACSSLITYWFMNRGVSGVVTDVTGDVADIKTRLQTLEHTVSPSVSAPSTVSPPVVTNAPVAP